MQYVLIFIKTILLRLDLMSLNSLIPIEKGLFKGFGIGNYILEL